jgi:hypothetical protein
VREKALLNGLRFIFAATTTIALFPAHTFAFNAQANCEDVIINTNGLPGLVASGSNTHSPTCSLERLIRSHLRSNSPADMRSHGRVVEFKRLMGVEPAVRSAGSKVISANQVDSASVAEDHVLISVHQHMEAALAHLGFQQPFRSELVDARYLSSNDIPAARGL